MDRRKEALELVNKMIADQTHESISDVLKALHAKASELKSQTYDPLKKNIEDMKKVDPKTKLPGTMLDKGTVMGDEQASLTPSDMTKNSPDANPPMEMSEDKKPLVEWMKKCMGMMKKHSEGLDKAKIDDGKRKDTKHNIRFERGQDRMHRSNVGVNSPWDTKGSKNDAGMSPAGKLNREMLGTIPRVGGSPTTDQHRKQWAKDDQKRHLNDLKSMPKPNLPKSELDKSSAVNMSEGGPLKMPAPNPKDPVMNYDKQGAKPTTASSQKKIEHFVNKPSPIKKDETVRPDAGFGSVTVKDSAPSSPGKVIMKDDMPHPAGSPEDKAHDIVEENQPIQDAVQDLGSHPAIKKMFEHLRNRQSEGKSWERSPENQAVGMDKGEMPRPDDAEPITSQAEKAIVASSDKPIKISEPRPGQANEPSKEK